MEYKKEIVQNVSNEIKSLFSNDLNNLVNRIVDEKLNKEKEVFYEKLNICQEEFPQKSARVVHTFENDEYLMDELTKNFGGDNRDWNIGVSNKCRYSINLRSRGWQLVDKELLTKSGWYNRSWSEYSISNDKIDINKEYYEILSLLLSRSLDQGPHSYHIFISKILLIYRKYHPKANEIYIIEQKTNKLLEKENEIKILEANYQKKYDELVDKENQLINKEIKLQEDINVHKEKIKNLFKRENEVKLKETINSCKDELMSSALSLNDVISIIPWPEDDDYDIIKTKIDNVINIMHKLI